MTRKPRLAAPPRAWIAVLALVVVGCTTVGPGPTIGVPPVPSGTTLPTPTPIGCPDDAELGTVSALAPVDRLGCYGNRTLTFEGVFGCGGCGGVDTRVGSPEWLTAAEFDFLNHPESMELGRLALHFPPDLTVPEPGDILRVVGHFDDPRANECRIAVVPDDNPDGSPVPIPEGEAIQYCRERFVVESFVVTGTGPAPVG